MYLEADSYPRPLEVSVNDKARHGAKMNVFIPIKKCPRCAMSAVRSTLPPSNASTRIGGLRYHHWRMRRT
jgi:hypothetical protein